MLLSRAHTAAPSRPTLAGRVVGSTNVDLVASARAFGAPEGYATFEQALIGAMHATLGARVPAAAIFRIGGRFYDQGIAQVGSRSRLRFETNPRSIADVRLPDPSVVALVDGLASLVIGNPTR
jgi:hypothetical protein